MIHSVHMSGKFNGPFQMISLIGNHEIITPYAPNSQLFYQTPHKFIAKWDYFPKFGKKLGLEKNGTN